MTAFEVLIVGGGPVGLGLAIELAQRGVHVGLVERYEQPQPVPKGQNLTQRTMEHFSAWGCEAELRAARTIPPAYGIGGLTAYKTLLGDYAYDWLARERVGQFYFAANERLPQYATEQVLRDRAAALPAITTLMGWKAQSLVAEQEQVRLHVARDGHEPQILTARYLVGCDGSRSMTREAAEITQTKTDHDRLMVLLVFRSLELHKLLERYPGKSFYNVLDPALEGYWKFFGRVDLEGEFFFHAPVPVAARSGDFDFLGYLHEAAGARFDVEISYTGFWDLRFAVADRYRQGRIFVAGDAAHSHPPYGGYGINTGFEDARNLGWKLAQVVQGHAPEALLDSYDAERRPVFETTARDFIAKSIEEDRAFLAKYDPELDRQAFETAWQGRAEGASSEVGSFAPHYRGSPIVSGEGEPSAVGHHAFVATPGAHLSPAPFTHGELSALLGRDFTLIALDAEPEDVAAFRVLGVTIIEDDRKGGRDRYDARLILVRPDHFISWSGSSLDQPAAEILDRALGRSEG